MNAEEILSFRIKPTNLVSHNFPGYGSVLVVKSLERPPLFGYIRVRLSGGIKWVKRLNSILAGVSIAF
jgi:hypothetical protein